MDTAKESATLFSRLSPSILDETDRLRVARQILAVLEAHLGPKGLGGRSVLDIGCSSGVITSFLAGVSGPVVGIDVDTDALRIARAHHARSNLDFRAMSGSTLDFPSNSFDAVICNQVYYWLDDPVRLMAEIYRVLKPGGTCFFGTVNKYKLWEAQYRLPFLSLLPKGLADFYVRTAGRGDRFGCRYLSFWELRRLCGDFVVHRYTARILKDPNRFNYTRLSAMKAVTARLPERWWAALEPLSPNFIWLLDKPQPPSSAGGAARGSP